MPFTMKTTGMDELEKQIGQLGDKGQQMAAVALYEGAGVMADAVSQAIHGIATEKFKYAAGGTKRLPSPEEKAILEQSKHGVAKFRNTGTKIETSIGFDNAGYAKITWNHARTNVRTKYKQQKSGKYAHASQGGGESSKPVEVIVNSINHGTSFMKKQPFLRKAFSQNQSAAVAAVEAGIRAREDELELD